MKSIRKTSLKQQASQTSLIFEKNLSKTTYYTPDQVVQWLFVSGAANAPEYCNRNKNTGEGSYLSISASFDTESSSFYIGDKKSGCMYVWMLGLNGLCLIGRTWSELQEVLSVISEKLSLDPEGKKLIIYVHNLSWDFQWMRKWISWYKVFSTGIRKPVYAVSVKGIEFRCSYQLSGYSLQSVGEHLSKHPITKAVGELNYDLIRHSKTPLTAEEIDYCLRDIKVVMAYIQEQIEIEGNITKIPMTKTAYVRRFCRNACFYGLEEHRIKWKRYQYRQMIMKLTLTPEEYKQAKRAFAGGFTHTSAFKANKIIYNVYHKDIRSSYPTTLICEMLPMSPAQSIVVESIEQFERLCNLYRVMTDIEIEDLNSIFWADHYISSSHCWYKEEALLDNGRVVRAKKVCLTITDADYFIIKRTYSGKIRFFNTRYYIKDYLPTDLVLAILDLYGAKTELKDVAEAILDYNLKKGMLNSTFGMAVTDICRPEIEYEEEWKSPKEPDLEEQIEKYNTSETRFLSYLWGVWCTSLSRAHVWAGILHLQGDYIYSDTDSIFYLHKNAHEKWFAHYDQVITDMAYRAMDYHNLPRELVKPKTIKGKEKIIGVWDDEPVAYEFKSLGAKRYIQRFYHKERFNKKKGRMVVEDCIELTVSGLNKKIVVPYLIRQYGFKNVLKNFSNHLYIPKRCTGKKVHTYIDGEEGDVLDGIITDYLGNTAEYHELSAIHLEDADYSLSLSREYADFLTQTSYSNGHNMYRV